MEANEKLVKELKDYEIHGGKMLLNHIKQLLEIIKPRLASDNESFYFYFDYKDFFEKEHKCYIRTNDEVLLNFLHYEIKKLYKDKK